MQSALAQETCSIEKVKDFQAEMNSHYADSLKSPLKKEDLKVFEALDFYPIDLKYCVQAIFKRTPKEKPFAMKTSTNRTPMYVKYGEITFQLDGKQHQLSIYQNIEFSKIEKYKNDLFLPFVDETSGDESYGGGRYIDLKIPDGDAVIINFNLAYNPYCAYNSGYSCPIPPQENYIEAMINAGVKMFIKH